MPKISRFRLAFTFRSTYDGSVVNPTCEALVTLGYRRDEIFYYPWHQPLIGGINSSNTLQRIYHDESDFVVVLLSPDYAEGKWTGIVEWRAVQDLINSGAAERICLLSVGDVDLGAIPGLYVTSDIAINIDGMSPEEVAWTIDDWIRYRS